MKGNMRIFCVLMAIISLQLLGESLIDVVNEAELFIERTYKGEMARQLAKTKLQNIVLDNEKTDRQKIEAIQKEFLQPKRDEEITEANAYRLIWTPPLSWDVHSIAIAYDVEKSVTQVISAETVEAKKTNRMNSNENGGKSSISEAGMTGLTTSLGYQTKISLAGLLTARPQFEIQAHGSHKKDWDESKTELWSKSRQEQLSSNFEELTKDILSTQVRGCHLTFAIDFRNNCDEALLFPASATIPVYMGRTFVLNAMPENIGNTPMFVIASRKTATIKFRGEISTTQAYRLLEFMKTNAPTILPEKGQLIISSQNNKVKDAINESLEVNHSVIRCGEYEWKVRSTWNNKHVRLREALWAINSLYEKGPFDIENDTCTTMFGKFRCGPYPDMAEAEVYPIVEMDSRFFSRLGKGQLDSRLPVKGVRFYMGSVRSYIDSEEYPSSFFKLLLDDLLSETGQDNTGEIKNLVGFMYVFGKGTMEDMAEAVKWYRKAAEQGYAKAQCNLGRCYYLGEGVPKDMAEAEKWYRKAAEQGDANAQFVLGAFYYFGIGVPKDMAEKVKWYRKAAEQGYAMAQCELGICYFEGNGVPKDMAEAVKWYSKAAEQGYAKAQYNLGRCYYFGEGVPKDMAEGEKWYRKAAEQGDANAQFALGVFYYLGEGVPKDMAEAVKWYRKAAEQGDARAQCELGICYFWGNGVTKDMAEAVRWYRKAVEQGYTQAQNLLGLCYEKGEGVQKDMTEAFKWYYKAAEQGNADAQWNLWRCYKNGKGVEMNESKAVEWCLKAAEQGNANAQCQLGIDYYVGERVSKNIFEAIKWWGKAAEQGNSGALFCLGTCYESGEGVKKDVLKAVELYRKAAEQGNNLAIRRLQKLNQ